MSPADPTLWFGLGAIVVSCFFAACNYALIDFSRGRLADWLARKGRSDNVDEILDLRDDLLMMTALVRTIANLAVLGVLVSWMAAPGSDSTWMDLAKAFAVAAAIIAVFGVGLPVSWSRYAQESLLGRSIRLLGMMHRVTWPLFRLLHWLDPVVRRLLGVSADAKDDSEQELLDAVTEGKASGLVDEAQQEMIEAVVEFPTITVDQIMTPRTDMEGITVESTLEDVKRFVDEAGHSRIPVYEGDLDHIVGVLYVKDLIRLLGTNPQEHFELRPLLREAVFVPELKPLRDLLSQFKASKVHMAIVLDEYGGTAGLVTIEDILEEIVGDIQDEYEPPAEEPAIDKLDDGTYAAHGRVYIDDVNDTLAIEIPEDEDYETIGGFVFAKLGRVPSAGEQFEAHGARFTVSGAEKTRVTQVRIEVLTAAEVAD